MSYDLSTLRQMFASSAQVTRTHLAPIRMISMVGAFALPDGMPRFEDTSYLIDTMHQIKDCGIPVHPAFEIDVVNIHPLHGGRDFLEEIKPADLVILCFIFNPPSNNSIYTDTANIHLNERYATSKNHFVKDIWHDSAVRVGAKIISIYGAHSSTETGSSYFKPDQTDSQFVTLEHPGAAMRSRFDPHILRHRSYAPA